VMAETMLEATVQYQSGQGRAQQPFSPRYSMFFIYLIFFCCCKSIPGKYLLLLPLYFFWGGEIELLKVCEKRTFYIS
jgi:hypothetical protein